MIRSSVDVLRASVVAAVLISAAQALQAADVTSYFVRKGLVYEQTSSGAPVGDPFNPGAFIARVEADTSAITSVNLSTPSTIFTQVPVDITGERYEFTIPGTMDDLNVFFPAGAYAFTLNDGETVVSLDLIAGAAPTAIPQVLNFTAAQSIDAAANFTLNFSPFTGAAAGDRYEFEVFDFDGSILFSTSGSGTSLVIPSGTLLTDETYDARLRFVHSVDTDTTSIPGATGSAGYYAENQFSISTGEGGGGDDTTPPTLVFTSPTNNATGVATSSPIIFIFDEEMAQQQSIQWSANVNPANFAYVWGQGNTSLTASYAGGLPANATITCNDHLVTDRRPYRLHGCRGKSPCGGCAGKL
jgi:hypothetical protein